MKIAYIVCTLIFQIFLLTGMVLIPVYITPGYYWWTALFFVVLIISSETASDRINYWSN